MTRLVKLRNPWGKGEWKGTWSDKDSKWTSALKRDFNLNPDADDGIFYMDYVDFCKYYSDFQICYYHDNYKYSALKVEKVQKTEDVFMEFEIRKSGEYYFSLNQINKRFFKKSQRYKYSNLAYVLSRQSPSGAIEFVGSNMKADKENWIVSHCKPGKYILMIKVNWRSFARDFSFSVYGPETCQINRVLFIFVIYTIINLVNTQSLIKDSQRFTKVLDICI